MAITSWGKAEDVLKKGGFDVSQMEKGTIKQLVLNKEDILKIVKKNENNTFEILNQAGKLLMGSVFTRDTGHKTNDFASIQSLSDVRVEVLFYNLKAIAKEQTGQKQSWESLKEEQRKLIWEKAKSKFRIIGQDLKKLNKIIDTSPEVSKGIRAFREKGKEEQRKIIDAAIKDMQDRGALSKDITFTHDGDDAGGGGGFGLALGALGMAMQMTRDGVAAFVMAAAILSIAAVPALVCYFKRESFRAISGKEWRRSLRDDYLKVLKKVNALDQYIDDEVAKQVKKNSKEVTVTKEIIDTINDFLSKQSKDWDLYTDAVKRDYYNAKDKSESGRHVSGVKISVSNKKKHTIGKLKEGLAKQWCNIKIDSKLLGSLK